MRKYVYEVWANGIQRFEVVRETERLVYVRTGIRDDYRRNKKNVFWNEEDALLHAIESCETRTKKALKAASKDEEQRQDHLCRLFKLQRGMETGDG